MKSVSGVLVFMVCVETQRSVWSSCIRETCLKFCCGARVNQMKLWRVPYYKLALHFRFTTWTSDWRIPSLNGKKTKHSIPLHSTELDLSLTTQINKNSIWSFKVYQRFQHPDYLFSMCVFNSHFVFCFRFAICGKLFKELVKNNHTTHPVRHTEPQRYNINIQPFKTKDTNDLLQVLTLFLSFLPFLPFFMGFSAGTILTKKKTTSAKWKTGHSCLTLLGISKHLHVISV